MEQLIADSVNILRQGDNIDLIYFWMDVGDLICNKLRTNQLLTETELENVNKLTKLLKSIVLTKDIILYRGLITEFNPLIGEQQFNALSPYLNTAETYGSNIIKVIVPKGSHGFYISAWELIREEQEEKEVLLLPGRFTLLAIENNCIKYNYSML